MLNEGTFGIGGALEVVPNEGIWGEFEAVPKVETLAPNDGPLG